MIKRHGKFIFGFIAGTFLGGFVIKFVSGIVGRR